MVGLGGDPGDVESRIASEFLPNLHVDFLNRGILVIGKHRNHRRVRGVGIVDGNSRQRQGRGCKLVVIVVSRPLSRECYTRARRSQQRSYATPIGIGAQLIAYAATIEKIENTVATAQYSFASSE